MRSGDAIPWKNRDGTQLQGMAKQILIDEIKFHDPSFKNKFDEVQKSVYRNGKWESLVEDKSIKVDKILDKIKDCN